MGSIPGEIVREVEALTGLVIKDFSAANGGCINAGGMITTTRDRYFVKWNDRSRYPGMFNAEARGLAILANPDTLPVPEVIHAGTAGGHQFLLLEYIEGSVRAKDYWQRFGSGLALQHERSSPDFGLDHDNYIGSLPQRNRMSSSWIQFFVEERLGFQVQIGRDAGEIDQPLKRKFEALYKKLPSLLPEETPALLHGDLWAGNLMTGADGGPCLIDPAVYYGCREVDLAMTQLFGGFDQAFFHAYEEVYPLAPGYRQRFDLYNLYPLLVHLNLFGGGYRSQVGAIVDRFV